MILLPLQRMMGKVKMLLSETVGWGILGLSPILWFSRWPRHWQKAQPPSLMTFSSSNGQTIRPLPLPTFLLAKHSWTKKNRQIQGPCSTKCIPLPNSNGTTTCELVRSTESHMIQILNEREPWGIGVHSKA